MVAESDNTASDALLRLAGVPEAVMQFLNKNGITGVEIANYEKEFAADSLTGPRRLKGLLPKDAVIANRTGTSGTRDGLTAATNDIGIITLPDGRHLAIAVFVSDSTADESVREETIAKIARAVWDNFSKKTIYE